MTDVERLCHYSRCRLGKLADSSSGSTDSLLSCLNNIEFFDDDDGCADYDKEHLVLASDDAVHEQPTVERRMTRKVKRVSRPSVDWTGNGETTEKIDRSESEGQADSYSSDQKETDKEISVQESQSESYPGNEDHRLQSPTTSLSLSSRAHTRAKLTFEEWLQVKFEQEQKRKLGESRRSAEKREQEKTTLEEKRKRQEKFNKRFPSWVQESVEKQQQRRQQQRQLARNLLENKVVEQAKLRQQEQENFNAWLKKKRQLKKDRLAEQQKAQQERQLKAAARREKSSEEYAGWKKRHRSVPAQLFGRIPFYQNPGYVNPIPWRGPLE